jgi:hypothetical protein
VTSAVEAYPWSSVGGAVEALRDMCDEPWFDKIIDSGIYHYTLVENLIPVERIGDREEAVEAVE